MLALQLMEDFATILNGRHLCNEGDCFHCGPVGHPFQWRSGWHWPHWPRALVAPPHLTCRGCSGVNRKWSDSHLALNEMRSRSNTSISKDAPSARLMMPTAGHAGNAHGLRLIIWQHLQDATRMMTHCTKVTLTFRFGTFFPMRLLVPAGLCTCPVRM